MLRCNIPRLLVLGALVALPLCANAAIFTFNLDGSQEVPANNSRAAGSGQVVIDVGLDTIDFAIVALGLTGSFIGAHIHNAPAGTNGPVVFDLGANADSVGPVVIGTMTVPNSISLAGSDKALQMSLASRISAQPWNYYVNIHTAAFPGGEIRGELAPIPEPATYGMLAAGLALLGLAAYRRRVIS